MESKKVLFIIPKNKMYGSLMELAKKIDVPVDIENDEESGYKALKKGGYGLVVSRMFSSTLNGYELVSKLKKDKIDCDVILIMGGRRERVRKDLLDNGVLSFIKKSGEEAELCERIKEYFKKKDSAKKDTAKGLMQKKFELESKVFELEEKLIGQKEELDYLKNKLKETNKEFKETKLRLSKKREYLVNSERMISIGQMTASIVHEINNPLTVITSLTALLAIECKDNPKISKYNHLLADNIDKLRNFTFSILSFTNPQRSEDPEDLKVNVVVEEVLTFYEYEIRRYDIALKKKYSDSLPHVNISRIKFQQIILNLLKNAVFATQKEKGIITIKTSQKDGYVIIEVKDNGAGISKKRLENIFRPFFSTKNKKDGTGLGLFICKEIVEKYNGTIKVKSVHKKGTTVTVTLPAVKA